MEKLRNILFGATLLAAAGVAAASDHDWRVYSGPGYRFELPVGDFEVVESAPGRVALEEAGAEVRIVAQAGAGNAASLAQLRETIELAAPVAEITYRAGGRSWFVLSGYTPDGAIWYTKVMLSGDRYAGFEIVYPKYEKSRMDAVVTRMEKGLRVGK